MDLKKITMEPSRLAWLAAIVMAAVCIWAAGSAAPVATAAQRGPASLPASAPAATQPTVKVEYNATGLSSIKVGDVEWLADGAPACAVYLEDPWHDSKGMLRYDFRKSAKPPAKTTPAADGQGHILQYTWGSMEIVYEPKPGRLNIAATLTNDSNHALADFDLTLLTLRLPEVLTGIKGQGAVVPTLDNLAIIEANCGGQRLLACCDTIYPPMYFGLDKPVGSGNDYPVVVHGGIPAPESGAFFLRLHGPMRVEPHKKLKLEFSLRWPAAQTDIDTAMADLYAKCAEYYKPLLKWPDRRPIGQLMIKTSPPKDPAAPGVNPRNWFDDPKMDVSTPAGKAKLKGLMMGYADNAIKVIKDMNGQGMIVWNLEGEENPQPISYIGDPRLVKYMAPEMDEVADAFFKKFRDANLRTGVCLRPTQVYFDKEKKAWTHGTGSEMLGRELPGGESNLLKLKPADLPDFQFFPIVERMCAKIEYAKKRWGCTIFYVDTNGITQYSSPDKGLWRLLDTEVWRLVLAKHPDVLIMPECRGGEGFFHMTAWACVGYYDEPEYGAMWRTPKRVKAIFPDAFSCIELKDAAKGFDEHRAEMVEGVRGGDLMLFRGWFADSVNTKIKAIYQDAAKK